MNRVDGFMQESVNCCWLIRTLVSCYWSLDIIPAIPLLNSVGSFFLSSDYFFFFFFFN